MKTTEAMGEVVEPGLTRVAKQCPVEVSQRRLKVNERDSRGCKSKRTRNRRRVKRTRERKGQTKGSVGDGNSWPPPLPCIQLTLTHRTIL